MPKLKLFPFILTFFLQFFVMLWFFMDLWLVLLSIFFNSMFGDESPLVDLKEDHLPKNLCLLGNLYWNTHSRRAFAQSKIQLISQLNSLIMKLIFKIMLGFTVRSNRSMHEALTFTDLHSFHGLYTQRWFKGADQIIVCRYTDVLGQAFLRECTLGML